MIADDLPPLAMRAIGGLAVGAVVGSFAATAALRLAAGRSPFRGRSQCDVCARRLGWVETVPFVSFAVSGGQCRACGGRIAPFHLAGEAMGAIALAVPLVLRDGWTAALTGSLCLCLLISALIDAKTLRLPDMLTVAVAACALGLAWLSGHLITGIMAAMGSGALLCAVKWWLERRSSRAMLGLGDIKLISALALWLNVRTPAMLALAAVIGLFVIRRHKGLMPFGPMIAAASFVIGVLMPESWFA